jgi:hypothetical protein
MQDRIRAYFLLHHFLHIGHQVVVMVLALIIVLAQEMRVDRAVRVVVQVVEAMLFFIPAVREMLVGMIPQKATTAAAQDLLDRVAVEVLEV